jgi:hypothetical protein
MKHQYRPLREMHGHSKAEDIQRDLDLMRAIYDRREPLNRRRNRKDAFATIVLKTLALMGVIFAVSILIFAR